MALPAASAFTDPTVTEAGFKTAMTDLINYLAALQTTPVGTIAAFAMSTNPSGFLKANGAAISRTTYAALFAKIGTTFGAGDGSTTFNLPDLRGLFPRAWDDGRGMDPGRVFGSFQNTTNLSHDHSTDSQGSHTHTVSGTKSDYGFPIIDTGSGWTYNASAVTSSAGAHTHYVNPNGASESRPRNLALLFCIKY